MSNEELKDKLVEFLVRKKNSKIILADGDPIVIIGVSLNIFSKEEITGRIPDGVELSVKVSDVKDLVEA